MCRDRENDVYVMYMCHVFNPNIFPKIACPPR